MSARRFTARRLLVALDASDHSLAALHAAVSLAARLGAELEGLFVEDENVLRWSRLPMGRVIDRSSAAVRRVDLRSVEAELRSQGERARLALEQAARARSVVWRFAVARGRVASRLLEAAAGADLIVMGRCSWARSRSHGLGATAREVVAGTGVAVLLLREGDRVEGPVVVVLGEGPSGTTALEVAAAVAQRDGGRLLMLAPPGVPDPAEASLPEGLNPSLRHLPGGGASAITRAALEAGAGLLVVPREACSGGPTEGSGLLRSAPCALLVVG